MLPQTTNGETNQPAKHGLILLTGGTGYVGGRLLTVLEKAGHTIRCISRNPDNLQSRTSDNVEIVAGDVLDPDSLRNAMAGVTTAFYLVHSMGSPLSFESQDRKECGELC